MAASYKSLELNVLPTSTLHRVTNILTDTSFKENQDQAHECIEKFEYLGLSCYIEVFSGISSSHH